MELPHDFRDTCSFALPDGTVIASRQQSVSSDAPHDETVGTRHSTVLLVHGLGEHSGRYVEVADEFARAGFRFVAYDQRGHGRSSGRRCDCEGLEQLCDDLEHVLNRITRGNQHAPVILYGHSFGGMVVLRYLLGRIAENKTSHAVAAAIVTSPLIRAQSPPHPAIIALGRLAAKVWPTVTLYAQIKGEQLSQLPEYTQRFHADPFCQGRVTARMGETLLDSGDWLLAHADKLPIPVQLHHGEDDTVTSWEASRTFSERAGDRCEFVSWPEQRHELHHEAIRETMFAQVIQWLKQTPWL